MLYEDWEMLFCNKISQERDPISEDHGQYASHIYNVIVRKPEKMVS